IRSQPRRRRRQLQRRRSERTDETLTSGAVHTKGSRLISHQGESFVSLVVFSRRLTRIDADKKKHQPQRSTKGTRVNKRIFLWLFLSVLSAFIRGQFSSC